MRQHVIHDEVAVRYADGVDHVWSAWSPALQRCERLLAAIATDVDLDGYDGDDVAAVLRSVQYRVHTSAEFAAGLVPPPSASDSHRLLLSSLAACRDVLSVLAVRAELDELDEEAALAGIGAARATRDAFASARTSTALVHAWTSDDEVDPVWVVERRTPSRTWSFLLWLAIAASAGLLTVLGVELLLR